MVVNGRPLKRMKRRVTADLYDFLTFPAIGDGSTVDLDGPFRSNIRSFLGKHACLPPPSSLFSPTSFPHLLTWQISFRIGDPDAGDSSVVSLDIVEEDVTRSRSVYCDHCRVVGWSGHPVCGKRYHFIIRADNYSSIDGHHQTCTSCGTLFHSSDSRCKTCNYEITADDIEDWVYLQLEDTTHLLHGVVHTNGYGHLLRVNGREGGSKFLSGCDIMDFWDRLCKALRVRKVTVMDVSKKYGLEYRLLHAVTNGRPWYGDWGYEFGAGSFALTADAYKTAVNVLSDMPLSRFFTHMRAPRTNLQDAVALYWSLSERRIATVRDLFRFIMALLHDIHSLAGGSVQKKPGNYAAVVSSPWPEDDVRPVECAMIKVLRAVGESQWVSWRTLRGAVYRTGLPKLLDYCLKDLGRVPVDGMIVHVRCNPETDVLEYRLETGKSVSEDAGSCENRGLAMSLNYPSEDHLLRDLKLLYDAILNPETMLKYRSRLVRELAHSSAAKLLDCKQFVKDYESTHLKVLNPNPIAVHVLCQVELDDQPEGYTAPPPELVVLPINATVYDLKLEAEKAFQEAYVLFKRFQVEKLVDYEDVKDSMLVTLLVGLQGWVRIRGQCGAENHDGWLNEFRMERGTENWTVDCLCGARDDDGEKMLACDLCGVWQHTRCVGIHDFEPVPLRFVCRRCDVLQGRGSRGGGCCKDEMSLMAPSSNEMTASFSVG
ncbi:RING/FYVE/PHD zinc finger superfamily protein [Tasmannia lanceolata]|uniref:RING/FYVE/PHD zinc finger superfamily protein n=1 Tax=Tasmannia lanceolata TaxID=3420 RepID=UPI00406344D5